MAVTEECGVVGLKGPGPVIEAECILEGGRVSEPRSQAARAWPVRWFRGKPEHWQLSGPIILSGPQEKAF